MPVSDTLRRSFQYWKRRNYHRPAHEIIKRARMDERDKVTQYPDPLPGPRIKRPTGSALYWFERPADIGLREVDHADEIYPEAIKHRGWYTDDDRMRPCAAMSGSCRPRMAALAMSPDSKTRGMTAKALSIATTSRSAIPARNTTTRQGARQH